MKWRVEHATAARDGEVESGDAVFVQQSDDQLLIAVVDALGHGPIAAVAARAAVDELRKFAGVGDVRALIGHVHERLRGTRGAAALLCVLTDQRIDACGIGNVEMRCTVAHLPIVITPGVLGKHTKTPRVFGGAARPGMRIIVYTDGISSRFELGAFRALSAGEAASKILADYRHAHDDATVLVADLGS